jgi:predicted  nucleic acid-binding Zn-ribbon protein
VSDRAQMLALLQDLELMIQEVQDPASKEKEEALGFSVDGLAKLEKERQKLLKRIPPADLRFYQRIRHKYPKAVVRVAGRICLGCWQTLPTSATRGVSEDGPLPTCENCGRVLYWT